MIIQQLMTQAIDRLRMIHGQGESYSGIAQRCGIDRSQLHRFMEGRVDTRVSTLDKILTVTHPKLEVK